MDKDQKQSSAWQELRSIFWVVLLAILFRILVIEPFFVPTGSMQATVLEREYIFATKYSYGYSKYSLPFAPDLFSGRILGSMPERGDIVITKSAHDLSTRFIKRVIGLPGDKIQLIDDVIHINNEPIKRTELGVVQIEDDKKYIKFREVLPSGVTYFAYKLQNPPQSRNNYTHFGPYYVPEDHFFLLGDNRDESGDSRFQIGFVPFEYLIAKAQFILLSTQEMLWEDGISPWQQVARIGTWLANIRFNRTFHRLYEKNYAPSESFVANHSQTSSELQKEERSNTNSPSEDRLLGKTAIDEEFARKSERRTGVYFNVHKDFKHPLTHKLPSVVEFSKKSNVLNTNNLNTNALNAINSQSEQET